MIEISKDLDNIPQSLLNKDTNEKRNEIILKQKFPTQKNISEFKYSLSTYESKYKTEDIKQELKTIYYHKCAFCESQAESFEVEHFRPKSIYYWLAYSWDNLLFCCRACNGFKSNKFETLQTPAKYNGEIEKIHSLCKEYNTLENNKLLNPEQDDILDKIHFKQDGSYDYDCCDLRMQYTIDTCQLNRDYLKELRQEVLNDFKQKLTNNFFKPEILENYINDFITDSENPVKEFIAFRKYIIANWLEQYLDKIII